MPNAPFEGVPASRRRIMQRNRRRDTAPELALRSVLHRRGMRFRVDHPIRVAQGRPIRPDVVFTRAKLAVFVDGCFWHGCPIHGTTPSTRTGYWIPKIHANRERDTRNTETLEACGWRVIRVWAHEDPETAAARIATAVQESAAR